MINPPAGIMAISSGGLLLQPSIPIESVKMKRSLKRGIMIPWLPD